MFASLANRGADPKAAMAGLVRSEAHQDPVVVLFELAKCLQ
jgi:hypothetical protein